MKIVTLGLSLMVLIALQTSLTSCNSTPTSTTLPGAWDKIGDFSGSPRSGAVGFVINGIAYVGTGFNYESNSRLIDFWKYDANTDSWSQVANLPGPARSNAVAFVIDNKAYVGTGTDDGLNALSDFYEFDPSVGTKGKWRQVADFGYSVATGDTLVTVRYGCVAFSVKNRGFVGGGHVTGSSDKKDLWEFIPDGGIGSWVQRPDIGGSKRLNGFVMVIGDYVYVGGGTDNLVLARDFYKFDVSKVDGTGSPWTPMNGLTGRDANGNAITQPRPRELASTFTIGNYGYLVCGSTGGPNGETWRYDPSTDSWTQYYSFTSNSPVAGSSRSSAVGFAIGDFGFITTGGSGTTFKFDDCWKFNPTGVEPDNK